jgi:hypothetical protein
VGLLITIFAVIMDAQMWWSTNYQHHVVTQDDSPDSKAPPQDFEDGDEDDDAEPDPRQWVSMKSLFISDPS